jgi:MFS family permease
MCAARGFHVWLPFLVVLLQDRGITLDRILWLQAIQSASQLLLEFPSGVCSDTLGRRYTLAIAGVLRVMMGVCILIGGGFWVYAIAFACFGAALAFDSGTDSALLYETLQESNTESEYKRLDGLGSALGNLSLAVACVVGGLIGAHSASAALSLQLLAYLVSFLAALCLHEPKGIRSETREFMQHLRGGIVLAASNRRLLLLSLYCGLLAANFVIFFRVVQPFMEAGSVHSSYFGWIYLLWLVLVTIAARTAYRVEARIGQRWMLPLLLLMCGLPLVFMGSAPFIISFLSIIALEVAFGLFSPITSDYLNRETGDDYRATVLSMRGFVGGILAIICAPLAGWGTVTLGLDLTCIIQGVLVITFGAILLALHGSLKHPQPYSSSIR